MNQDAQTMFDALPTDKMVGNVSFRDQLKWDEARYNAAKNELRALGKVKVGPGRGGSLGRAELVPAETKPEIAQVEEEIEHLDPTAPSIEVEPDSADRVLRVLQAVYPKTEFLLRENRIHIVRPFCNAISPDVMERLVKIAEAAK